MAARGPTTVQVAGVNYLSHPPHRNGAGGKSQWQIAFVDETSSFVLATAQRWGDGRERWGLHPNVGAIQYLGVAQDHSTQVFICKFVDTGSSGTWHGYPADHMDNDQDIPYPRILTAWMNAGRLTAAKVRKLLKGQRCGL